MTPQFSVFTPTHKPQFLQAAYQSLLDQSCQDWEWIVAPNHGAVVTGLDDVRVRVLPDAGAVEYVGALKSQACAQARGQVLVELDHDDVLMRSALVDLKEAFATGAGFVYSDAIHCDKAFEKLDTPRYSSEFGWRYHESALDAPISFDPTPEAVSRIWYAPNHVRAFRRDLYERIGGYNQGMRVLDDQELMSRMFVETAFHHIERPLYMYRIHGENSWLQHNDEIQNNVYRLYDKYIQPMSLAHSKRKGLRAIELGGRFAAQPGFETVDLRDADICCDLNSPWPFADGSVGTVRAMDVFEHLRDPLHVMKELYRVLAPGGMAFIHVPSTDGRGAFQDPTHVSYWNENSWLYYCHAKWAKYIDTPVRFQSTRRYTTEKDAIGVCWTVAHLVSLKDGYRPPGIIEI